MKRAISLIILSALTLCALLSALPSYAATPEGSPIKSEADFLAMSANGAYYLENDITISSSYQNDFSGTLDGNGKKIKISENANVSPFNSIKGASLKNLTVEGIINILSKTTYGGIAMSGYGSFENVTAKVGISAMVETVGGSQFESVGVSQGGFIGKATGPTSFVNCTNESSITVITTKKSASSNINAGFGGFIGSVFAHNDDIRFTNCNNNAAITSREPQICVGGFIGVSCNANLSFYSCNNNALIFGTSEKEGHNGAGGFVGTMVSGILTVRSCHNIGDVQNDGPTGHTAGLIGRSSAVFEIDIDGFKNLRSIYNPSNYWEGVSGVIGILSDVPKGATGTYTFKNCMNCAWVRGSIAGGIIGLEQSAHGIDLKFERCLNTSSVISLGQSYCGGILGRSNGELRSLTFSECLNCGEITTNTESGWGVGGICGNIGEDGHTYTLSPIFENCVNMGAINCKSSSNAVSAAGILSRNIYTTTTIKNCINLGTLNNNVHASNIVPIATNPGSATYYVSGCSYLSGTGNAVFSETAKSLTDIRADVAVALSSGFEPESRYYNYRNSDSDVNSVGEGIDRILTAESISHIKQGALAIFDYCGALVLISDIKAEIISKLGSALSNADGTYTEDSYAAYLVALNKIKSDINAASDASALDAINVDALISEAEAKLIKVEDLPKDTPTDEEESKNDSANEGILEPDSTTDTPNNGTIENNTTGSNSTNESSSDASASPSKSKGCFGSTSLSALAVTCIIGTALAFRKKKKF